ncbi:glycosyltransferase family 2 protein [Cohaesibacter marisflavi]|uniref:glycosyltransferase family 2 protein n=1 Tax=Cohaesibacter marisflavi TaxID=655353 RepID=UPI0029C620BD|nr:hypothetical protein [Cohaesibacter marisflavi]
MSESICSSTALDNLAAGPTEFVAQKLLAPDPSVNSEVDLFYHCEGQAGYDTNLGTYYCFKESSLIFDGYYNVFPLHCYDVSSDHKLKIRIKIKGEGILRMYMAKKEASWEQLIHTLFDYDELETVEFDLPLLDGIGLLFMQVYAKTEVTVVSADYIIEGPVLNDATITGVITTFKRDDAVQSTSDRLDAYFQENEDIADLFQLLVIDNGGDTDEISFSRGRVIKNKNYGGAGGFSRGLLEAMEGNLSSHVLFMDDDATIFPESLRRTLAALRYSNDPKRAISGAMIAETHKWMMWENSALFNKRCIPLHNRVDLRLFSNVIKCAFENQQTHKNRYGGWWYFCFPISEVTNWTFPFFVRGDDIYFSLANDFNIITMPGVVSIQEDFEVKQTPLINYLDARYHLIQHLTFPMLRHSFWSDFMMIWRYFDRYNSSYHYESAEAINIAIEDVLKGPEFWTDDMDMSDKRSQIKELTKNEAITPNIDIGHIQLINPGIGRFRKAYILRKLTLCGHILPPFFFFARGRRMPLSARAAPWETFLRPVVATMDRSDKNGYVCKIDRPRYFKNLWRFFKNMRAFTKARNGLIADYERMKDKELHKSFWKKVLLED